jgi:serine/threonine-protein kinase HipA
MISNIDDHLRNHGLPCLDRTGWSLSPAYDLNPVPTDLKAHVLTTNIDLDEGACSLATATATWRNVAQKVDARD